MQVTVQTIYDELTKRGLEIKVVDLVTLGGSLLVFRYKGKLHTISGSSPDLTSASARTICADKAATQVIAQELDVLMPETSSDISAANAFLAQYGTVVVKPTNGAHGHGVTTNITTEPQLHAAIAEAKDLFDGGVLIQQQVGGADYRILVIGGKMAACAQRVPANVTGDGTSTIRQLIQHENATNPRRGYNYEKPLNKIDESLAEKYLGSRIEDIPANGENVAVVGTANIGTGGEAIDRTADVPAAMIQQAERIATEIGAFICGVDFMYDSDRDTWYLIELNSSPSFGLHISPSQGESIDLAPLFVDRLFAMYDADNY